MARRYQKLEAFHPSYEQLVIKAVDAWSEYSVRRNPWVHFETKYVQWKCYKCSKPILVKYNITRFRYLYCERCRPRFVRIVDGIMLRYFVTFKEHVRKILLHNAGLGPDPMNEKDGNS